MKKRVLLVIISVLSRHIFSAEKIAELEFKPVKKFVIEQPGTTTLTFETFKNFTDWQENRPLNGGYCFKSGQLNSTLFRVVPNAHDCHEVSLQLAVKSAHSIHFATQLLKWNGEQWLWEEPIFNGYAYEFDCEVPSSPVIHLRKPFEAEEQAVFFGREYETQQIGFVTGGSIQDAWIEFNKINKTCHLVMPYQYNIDRSGRICSGKKKVILPEEAIKPMAQINLARHNSVNSSVDMSSSVESRQEHDDE